MLTDRLITETAPILLQEARASMAEHITPQGETSIEAEFGKKQ